jgi:hypothetical protein
MSQKDLISHYKKRTICHLDPCRGDAIPVVYGTPGKELSQLSSLELVHLAGCFTPEKKASYYCKKCHQYIYPKLSTKSFF